MDKQNDTYSNNPADLKSYEQQIDDKKSFLGDLFNKIKTKREQKLLNSGSSEKVQTTGQSISFLWGFGSFRKALFDTLENVRKSLFQKSNSNEIKNTLDTYVFSENSPENTFEKTLDNSENTIDVIVPVSKSTSKGPITLPNEKTTNDQNKSNEELEESENGLESSDTEENKSSNSELKAESLDASAAIKEKNEKNLQSNIPQPEFTAPKDAREDASEKEDR